MSSGCDNFSFSAGADNFTMSQAAGSFNGASNVTVQPAAIAPSYSHTSTYDVGDYVMYGGLLYVCNTTISTPESWNSAHWTLTNATSIVPEIEVDSALSDSSENPVQNKVITDALLDKAPIIHDTATGAIASFSDGSGYAFDDVVVGIEPVQDLNGYDSPWPGGGGKNLLPDLTGVASSTMLNIGTDSTSATYDIQLEAGTYTLSVGFLNNAHYGAFYREENDSAHTTIWTTNSSATSGTFSITSSGSYRFWLYVSSGVTADDVDWFQLESGSTATAWTPYSNICPITGHTEANVTRTGKNLFDPSKRTESSTNIYYYSSNGLLLKGGQAYTLSVSTTASGLYIKPYPSGANLATAYNKTALTYTPPNDVQVSFDIFYASAPSGGTSAVNCQLELGSTATTYEPYTGTSLTIDLDGTRYGGSLDVTTGVLTVTDANIASYAGETLPSTWISDRDVYAVGTTPTTGAQVVYKLATPITVQLTAQQLDTLQGDNNVWCDTGDTTATYPCDTKQFILKKIAEATA